MYTYIYIERERDIHMYMYIYIYIYICLHVYREREGREIVASHGRRGVLQRHPGVGDGGDHNLS